MVSITEADRAARAPWQIQKDLQKLFGERVSLSPSYHNALLRRKKWVSEIDISLTYQVMGPIYQ